MARVNYTDEDGLVSVFDVPGDVDPIYYNLGALIGPPDLSSLEFDRAVIREINNALVKERLLIAPDLGKPGAMSKVYQILSKILKLSEDKTRDTLRQIVSIYQQDYYPAQFEEDLS